MQDLREFNSGADYDAQYDALYENEITTLSKVAAERGGPVLDICCGTGIVTIAVAANNPELEVVGFDISKAMMAHGKVKASNQNVTNVSFHQGDMVHFDLFDLNLEFETAFMTGNSFQGLMSQKDMRQTLKNIHDHMAPKGKFFLDTRLAENFDFSVQKEFVQGESYTDSNGRMVNYFSKLIKHDVDNNICYIEKMRRYEDGTEVPSGIDLKFFDYEELLGHIKDCGFKVMGEYSNWSLDSFDEDGAGVVLELKA